jgi:hypothetical protein
MNFVFMVNVIECDIECYRFIYFYNANNYKCKLSLKVLIQQLKRTNIGNEFKTSEIRSQFFGNIQTFGSLIIFQQATEGSFGGAES